MLIFMVKNVLIVLFLVWNVKNNRIYAKLALTKNIISQTNLLA
jgi:hypothetical protein